MMRALAILLVAASALAAEIPNGFILAGRAVSFDAEARPRFTREQIEAASRTTLVGFDRWARTNEGRAIIASLRERDRTVFIEEDESEPSLGRAPQPAFTTLLAARDANVQKRYTIVLNPLMASQFDADDPPDAGPRSGADAMALAWAAEMLHIAFYADGIPLPHHERADFQARWRAVATELGLPQTPHGEQD